MMRVVLEEADDTQWELDVPWIPSLRPRRLMNDGRTYDQNRILPDGRWVYRTREARPAVTTQRIRFNFGDGCTIGDCLVPATFDLPTVWDFAGHTYKQWSLQPDGTVDYYTWELLNSEERAKTARVAAEFSRAQMSVGRSSKVKDVG